MRTIIDLPAEQIEALARTCQESGISRAEAVRRAVAMYLSSLPTRMPADEAFGLWGSREMDSLVYEDQLRSEWTDC